MPLLGVTAQPLKFLDDVLEDPTQTVLLSTAGHYCVVSVPSPARYAIHKLIVHGVPSARQHVSERDGLLPRPAGTRVHPSHPH